MRTTRRTTRKHCRPARGLTLIELLIVITIMLMITAASIPVMLPALQNRRTREASRLVTSFIAGARSRAIQTGRPVGVMFERFKPSTVDVLGNPTATPALPFSFKLSYVEVPPPYSGDTTASQMSVARYKVTGTVTNAADNGFGKIRLTLTPALPSTLQPDFYITIAGVGGTVEANGDWKLVLIDPTHIDLPAAFVNAYTGGGTYTLYCWPCVAGMSDTQWKGQGLLRYGDRLSLDFKGPQYVLTSQLPPLPSTGDPMFGKVVTTDPPGDSTNGYWFLLDANGNSPNLPKAYAFGVAFQFFRQPSRTSTPPLQLPEGAVIDLTNSGMGITGAYGASVNTDPVIMFSPNGSLVNTSQNFTNGWQLAHPTGPMFFLLGRRDLMPDVSKTGNDDNLYEPSTAPKPLNLYLQNFWIAVGPQTGHITVSEMAVNNNSLTTARKFAQQAQSTGGR